jgi:hypothetical protein
MAKTKGAVQFGLVTLDELNRILKPAATVLVSVKYAKEVGLSIRPVALDNERVKATAASQEEVVERVDFTAPAAKSKGKRANKTELSQEELDASEPITVHKTTW